MSPVYSGRCEECHQYQRQFFCEYSQVVAKRCKYCCRVSRFTISIDDEIGGEQ